jgi:hypothetical protein
MGQYAGLALTVHDGAMPANLSNRRSGAAKDASLGCGIDSDGVRTIRRKP